MATVGELTSYRGDAGLGLGSNPQIPVSSPEKFETTNQILRDVAARQFQKNIIKYNQQIKDRDNFYEALDNGKIKYGDLLDRDMPIVRKALDEQTQAFKEWMKNGYGDIDGAVKYKKATQAANEAVTQAQARKAYFDKESGTISKEGIPKFAQARQAQLDKNLENFWGDIVPFQETSRLNLAPIEKFAESFTEEFTDPAKPYEKGKRTQFSYGGTLRNAQKYGLTPEGFYNLQVLHDTLAEMSPVELIDKIKSVNKELERYNRERNLNVGDEDYAEPIQIVQGKDGRLQINEPIDKLGAKISLAGQPKYSSETFEVDKGKLDLRKQAEAERAAKAREAIGRTNAEANMKRATAYSNLQNKKLSQLTDQEKRTKNFWNGITSRVKSFKLADGSQQDFVFAGDLPEGYQFIGGIGADGNPIKLQPKDRGGIKFYETRFYDIDGNQIDLRSQFEEYKKQGGKGNYDDLRKQLLTNGSINMELVGKNGVGDFETAYQTARVISNKATSKGEEPVFGEETTIVNEEEQ